MFAEGGPLAAEQTYLDGPKLAAWIAGRVDLVTVFQEQPTVRDRIRKWRNGDCPQARGADSVLTRLGLHLSRVPDGIYIEFRRAAAVSDRDRNRAVALYRKGKTPAEIAPKFGVRPTTVTHWAQKAGAGTGKRGGHRHGLEPAHIERILSLYKEGELTLEGIAKECGVTASTVSKHAKRAGLQGQKGRHRIKAERISGSKGVGK